MLFRTTMKKPWHWDEWSYVLQELFHPVNAPSFWSGLSAQRASSSASLPRWSSGYVWGPEAPPQAGGLRTWEGQCAGLIWQEQHCKKPRFWLQKPVNVKKNWAMCYVDLHTFFPDAFEHQALEVYCLQKICWEVQKNRGTLLHNCAIFLYSILAKITKCNICYHFTGYHQQGRPWWEGSFLGWFSCSKQYLSATPSHE